jgi:hypothetical protein
MDPGETISHTFRHGLALPLDMTKDGRSRHRDSPCPFYEISVSAEDPHYLLPRPDASLFGDPRHGIPAAKNSGAIRRMPGGPIQTKIRSATRI